MVVYLLVPTLRVGTRCLRDAPASRTESLQRRGSFVVRPGRDAGASRGRAFPRGAWERGATSAEATLAQPPDDQDHQAEVGEQGRQPQPAAPGPQVAVARRQVDAR